MQIKQTELHLYQHLKPKSTWRKEGFKVKKDAVAEYWAYQKFTHEPYNLYSEDQVERITRTLTDEHKEKLRLGREKNLTCSRCQHVVNHLSHLDEDKVCISCHREAQFEAKRAQEEYHQNKAEREVADLFKDLLSQNEVLMLHGESTGLTYSSDELCQLTITDIKGNTLFCSLIKPIKEVSKGAYFCHRISDEMLEKAPSFKEIADEVFKILKDKTVVTYNSDFFLSMLENSAKAHNLEFELSGLNLKSKCLMHQCSKYLDYDYRYYTSLYNMVNSLNITIKTDRDYHFDCLAYIEVMKSIVAIDESRK